MESVDEVVSRICRIVPCGTLCDVYSHLDAREHEVFACSAASNALVQALCTEVFDSGIRFYARPRGEDEGVAVDLYAQSLDPALGPKFSVFYSISCILPIAYYDFYQPDGRRAKLESVPMILQSIHSNVMERMRFAGFRIVGHDDPILLSTVDGYYMQVWADGGGASRKVVACVGEILFYDSLWELGHQSSEMRF